MDTTKFSRVPHTVKKNKGSELYYLILCAVCVHVCVFGSTMDWTQGLVHICKHSSTELHIPSPLNFPECFFIICVCICACMCTCMCVPAQKKALDPLMLELLAVVSWLICVTHWEVNSGPLQQQVLLTLQPSELFFFFSRKSTCGMEDLLSSFVSSFFVCLFVLNRVSL